MGVKAFSPTAPRCLRTARYGDQGVTPGRTSSVLSAAFQIPELVEYEQRR